MKQLLPCLILAASFAASPPARAADAPPAGVVNLMSSASVEVAKDWMTATLSVTRDGPDANAVQSGLKQALDTALIEARKVAKPGQVEVQPEMGPDLE